MDGEQARAVQTVRKEVAREDEAVHPARMTTTPLRVAAPSPPLMVNRTAHGVVTALIALLVIAAPAGASQVAARRDHADLHGAAGREQLGAGLGRQLRHHLRQRPGALPDGG